MSEYLLVILRTLITFSVLLIIGRMMGKQQI